MLICDAVARCHREVTAHVVRGGVVLHGKLTLVLVPKMQGVKIRRP